MRDGKVAGLKVFFSSSGGRLKIEPLTKRFNGISSRVKGTTSLTVQ